MVKGASPGSTEPEPISRLSMPPARGGALRQLIEAGKVAAEAEAAIAAEAPLAIEHRQARDFDRERCAIIVDRPADRNSAERVAGRERARDLAVRIKPQRFG